MYRGFPDPDQIDPAIKERVRTFIFKASRNESVLWNSKDQCTIWEDRPNGEGRLVRVRAGSHYDIDSGGTEIYLLHDPNQTTPIWVPGLLSALSQFFGISGEPEVKEALISMATRMAADLFRPLHQSLAETFDGIQLVHLAVNPQKNLLAGQYPSEYPDSDPLWRLAITGESVVVKDDPSWTIFGLQP